MIFLPAYFTLSKGSATCHFQHCQPIKWQHILMQAGDVLLTFILSPSLLFCTCRHNLPPLVGRLPHSPTPSVHHEGACSKDLHQVWPGSWIELVLSKLGDDRHGRCQRKAIAVWPRKSQLHSNCYSSIGPLFGGFQVRHLIRCWSHCCETFCSTFWSHITTKFQHVSASTGIPHIIPGLRLHALQWEYASPFLQKPSPL